MRKDIRLDKDSKHPFDSETVYFGTKHGKVKAVESHFLSVGMKCEAVEIDTDLFGTFTGEVERQGSVRETLRKKVAAVLEAVPEARFILASEGSFGPHPLIGFIPSDLEMLLFFDGQTGLEIFVDELSTQTNHDEVEVKSIEDIKVALSRFQFPSHAVIVRPKGDSKIIFKGLMDLESVRNAFAKSLNVSIDLTVIISTDMRACFNPTRMSVISKAGERLLSRLKSFCPSCLEVGLGPVLGNKGMPCSHCGLRTQLVKDVTYSCPFCHYTEIRPRDDGKKYADPAECEFCNP